MAVVALLFIARNVLSLRVSGAIDSHPAGGIETGAANRHTGCGRNIGYRLSFMASPPPPAPLGAQALATRPMRAADLFTGADVGLSIGLSMEIAIGHLAGTGKLRGSRYAVAGGAFGLH